MIISSGLPDGTERFFLPLNLLNGAIAAALLIVLYFISLQNYPLFHGLVEIAGIAVVFSIFIIIWNTRRVVPDAFFLIIGISFLFIGSIDLVHMLAFRGMAIFPTDSNQHLHTAPDCSTLFPEHHVPYCDTLYRKVHNKKPEL